jgi:hypothetical protein
MGRLTDQQKEELKKSIQAHPTYKTLVEDEGLEAAEETIDYQVFTVDYFSNEGDSLLTQVSLQFDDFMKNPHSTWQDFKNIIINVSIRSYLFGGVVYRRWLTKNGIDVFEMDEKCKKVEGGDNIPY